MDNIKIPRDKKDIQDVLALTPMQQGMLHYYLKSPGSSRYVEQLSLFLRGDIDVSRIKQAWNRVTRINEMLRTVYHWEKIKKPVQMVLNKHEVDLRCYDFSTDPEKITQFKEQDRAEAFDLTCVPFRITLCKTAPHQAHMIITNHHILYDGWSNSIILSEFFRFYADIAQQRESELIVKTKFKEFLKWSLNGDHRQEQENFWNRYLRDDSQPGTSLPVNVKKRGDVTHTRQMTLHLPQQLSRKFPAFVKEHKITLSTLFYTAWGLLLMHYNQEKDLLFDTTVSGRPTEIKGIENMVGMFINTLPLRIRSRRGETPAHLLQRTHREIRRRKDYENTSPVHLNEYLENRGEQLLFNSVLVLENYPLDPAAIQAGGPLKVENFSNRGMTNYDVTLIITLLDTIGLDAIYNAELLDEEDLKNISGDFNSLLEILVNRTYMPLDHSQLLPQDPARTTSKRLLQKRRQSVATVDETPYIAPRNDLEKKLALTWSRVLNIAPETIGIDSNFFDFGGHSLKASLLTARIHRDLGVIVPLAELFKNPTIRQSAAYIKNAAPARFNPILPAEEKELYPLSSAQIRLFFLQQMEPRSTAYNGPMMVELKGPLNDPQKNTIKDTFMQLIRRHHILHTAFITLDGQPVMKVRDPRQLSINLEDTSPEYFIRPFDLSRPPLLRLAITKTAEHQHLMMVDMHHIVTDGMSQDIFIREFNHLLRGETLPAIPLRYVDFTHWQNRRLYEGELQKKELYWLQRLVSPLPVLDIPTDFPRPPMQQFEGETLHFHLGDPWLSGLRNLQANTGTTLFMVLIAAFNMLLRTYSGGQDIIIGTTTAGRHHADLQSMMGLLLETLALRNFPTADKSFAAFLAEVKQSTLEAYENQGYPFRELMKHTDQQKDLSRNPIFDVMLILQNMETSVPDIPGVQCRSVPLDAKISKLDLTIEVEETRQGLDMTLEYATALFTDRTAKRLARHFINLLKQIADTGQQPGAAQLPLAGFQLQDEQEKKMLLDKFNRTHYDFDTLQTVPAALARTVSQSPDAIALAGHINCNCLQLTYRELHCRSNSLADLLIRSGVTSGTVVAVISEPSPAMLIVLLAILKSGGTYLPIDPAYPLQRIRYMLADSSTRLIVTIGTDGQYHHLIGTWDGEIIHSPDGRFSSPLAEQSSVPAPVSPADPAYIIYTSGSTGRPRGVLVEHCNLWAYIHSFYKDFPLTGGDTMLQQASYAFDVFIEEVFPILLRGGRLAIPDSETVRDISLLAAFIQRHAVTIVDCSPLMLSRFNQLPSLIPLQTVHTYINGGDVLESEYIHRLRENARVVNTYGPTESTVCAAYYTCPAQLPTVIPIGKPIANYRIYILDPALRLLPIGVPGELCVSGAGVTRGYLNHPERTAQQFIANPFIDLDPPANHDQGLLYRTGDRAQWTEDGNILFMGRIDQQVKIRGYRIETGEIETCLRTHPDVKDVVSAVRENGPGNRYLCTYFVSETLADADSALLVPQLKEFLARYLPDYMIPSFIIPLSQIPMTPTGKLDRRALPAPDIRFLHGNGQPVAPSTDTEKKLQVIWNDLLPIENPGVTDDFFELGGDSILVNRCIARIRDQFNTEIPLRAFFEHPTISALADEISNREIDTTRIPRAERTGEIPLSFAQERLWFLQNLDSQNVSYFVPRILRMTGELDVSIIERTFTEIIRRHEILRTLFPTVEGRPVQRILDPYYFHIPILDWQTKDEEVQKRDIAAFLEQEGGNAFDFENGPLLRVTMVKLKPQQHLMVLTEHHLIHDGWTQGVLLKEFIAVYTAYTECRQHTLPDLDIQYADYAVWQRQLLSGDVLQGHLDYWKKKLLPPAPVLEIPGDRPRPPVISGEGGLHMLRLSPAFSRHLIEFSRNNGVTLFMTMSAVFNTFLFRYTGVQDLCVGTGIANRRYREIETMLGMIINTLALRTDLSGDIDFKECLSRVRETCLEAYQHEDTPFGKVVEVLKPERNLSFSPVYQTMFSFMDTPTENLRLPGLHLQLEDFHNKSSKSDINVIVVPPREQDEEILIEWEYNTDILSDATTQRMVSHYQRLLEECSRNPGTSIARVPMLSETETRCLLETFNNTASQYPKEKTIHQLFQEQALQTPHRIVVVGASAPEDQSVIQLTYLELDHRSHLLAHRLKTEGAGIGSIVAIRTARSAEMVVAQLAILKAGAAYMPIPLDYPRERINYMLVDSACKILITSTPNQPDTDTDTPIIPIIPITPITPIIPLTPIIPISPTQPSSDPAYIIYTSGSTGKPKGVIVQHNNVARLVKNTNLIDFHDDARLLATGPIGFDISTFETWYPLLNSIQLHLTDDSGFLDVQKLERNLVKQKITILHLVSQLFSSVSSIAPVVFGHIRYLLVGGDVVRPKHVDQIRQKYSQLKILHMYGPTENTVFSTFFPVLEKLNDRIPIGKPYTNSSVYIFDKYRRPVPVGVVGELWTGGDGLARGYLNRVELTYEKFDYSSQVPGQPLYRTGDLARWLPDGNIEFLGRIDNQVKILGFRVELGELENLLLRMDGIKEAAAAAYEADQQDREKNTYICAYIVPVNRQLDEKVLRKELEAQLPHYMVPAHILQLETMPITANGKIDRRALPKPQRKAEAGIVAPQDEIQRKLAAIWADILNIDIAIIGVDSNFFHIGGHSLKAAILAAAVNKEFHAQIPLTEIFQSPTIWSMADYIREADACLHSDVQPAEEKEYYPLSPAQGRLYIVEQMGEGSTNYNMAVTLLLDGELQPDRLKHVFQQLIVRHESLRTSFHIIGTRPIQKIHRHLDFDLQYEEVGLTGEVIDSIILRTAQQMNRPFDLSHAPLFTAKLVKISGTRHILSFNMHHIVTDGTSLQLMIKEMLALYAGQNPPLPPLQYKDYCQWQHRLILSGELRKQETFWLDLYQGDIPQLELPMDFPRPRIKKFVGAAESFELDLEQTAALNHLARQQEATLYMVLLAVYNVFLSKLCHMDDILVGTSAAGRRAAGLEHIVGMFINTLCLRNRPVADLSFNCFLRDLKKRSINAFENQDYQFEDLVENIAVKHIPGRNPLFNVNFSFHNEIQDFGSEGIQIPGLRMTHYEPDTVPAKFDLTLQGVEKEGILHMTFQYDTALFKQKSIRTFAEKFKRVVSSVIQEPHRLLGDIKIISHTKEQEMLSNAFDDLEDE